MENEYQEKMNRETLGKVHADEFRLPEEVSAYRIAQRSMVDLKVAVYYIILIGPQDGLTNADIGRKLGIYAGHVGHEGHISRTILGILEGEGLLQQDPNSKRWLIRR